MATFAFIVEAVYAIDRGTLVVSSKQKEVLWILDLVGKEEADSLKRLLSSVNVIAEEEIV